ENYTESLWVAEGITSFYDDLIVHRAGLSTETEYFEALSRSMEAVMSSPGRLRQSLTVSSYDAWIKLYRRDENFVNSGISYYTKGALVAWLLDAEIRRASAFKKSLDDVMRLAYRRYSGECGYTESQFREVVDEVAGKDLAPFFERYVDGTADLDFEPVFELYGLRFKPNDAGTAEGPQGSDPWFGHVAPRFGVKTKNQDGRVIVEVVLADEPAAKAGINSGDEIIALGGIRVTPNNFDTRIQAQRAGEAIEVTIARRDVLSTRTVNLEPAPVHEWKVEVDPDSTEEQTDRRRRWLSSNRSKS
ncbi:MAG: PDZ domain-containing protein, partial [Myxococcota bacterium]